MSAPRRDGRSTRWDPHRRERRLAIITAAVDAVELYGPDALTAQIADKAGVPRTHVYRHFDDKQALDRAVSRYVAGQLGERLRAGWTEPGSPRQIIRSSVEAHLSWIEQHPNLYRFLAQHSYTVASTGTQTLDDAKAVFAGELSGLLRGYLRALQLDDAPAERVVVGVVGMVDATAAWWLEHHDVSRDELAAALTEQVWLIIDQTTRAQGLALDPDALLPAAPPAASAARESGVEVG